MPEDIELYVGMIKRLKPEQAKELAERMDMMSERRARISMGLLLIPIILMVVLILIFH